MIDTKKRNLDRREKKQMQKKLLKAEGVMSCKRSQKFSMGKENKQPKTERRYRLVRRVDHFCERLYQEGPIHQIREL